MKRKGLLCLLLAFALAVSGLGAAAAEDCFTIDIDVLDMDSLNSDEYIAQKLSSGAQGVRVRKYLSDSSELAAPVRLTLTQMDTQTILLDKNYGFCSGTFDSGVIYLPYVDDRTIPYLVTLYVGDYVYATPFMHRQARLSWNSACTEGLRLRDLGLGGDWLMGTMVDLNSLRAQGSQMVDLCASNSYRIGQAELRMDGSRLKVELLFAAEADVELNWAEVYVAADCAAWRDGLRGAAHGVGEWIEVGGAESALVYVPMQVSYDPSGLPAFTYAADAWQQSLWEANTARGDGAQTEDGWNSDDWTESDDWAESDGGSDDDWAESDSGDWAGDWEDGGLNAEPWVGNGWGDTSGWVENDGWDENNGWEDGWSSDAEGWADAPGDGW